MAVAVSIINLNKRAKTQNCCQQFWYHVFETHPAVPPYHTFKRLKQLRTAPVLCDSYASFNVPGIAL